MYYVTSVSICHHIKNILSITVYEHAGTNYSFKQLYNCEECDATFKSKLGMNLHTRTNHEGVMYSCDQCKYQASWPGHLKQYKESIQKGVIHLCNHCEFQSTQKMKLTTIIFDHYFSAPIIYEGGGE